MLSLIALITILAIVALLLSGRVSPIICLVIVPIIGALVAGFGFNEISGFFNKGIHTVLSVVAMFIFAILFFGLMNDAGLFEPLIDKMVSVTKGNVVSVCVGTVFVGAVAHLDGSGATTFLIALPPLLPLYKRLRMDPYLLMLLVSTSAAVVNMVPWAGPLGRTAAVLKVDATALWRPLIPVQVIAMVLLVGMAVLLGMRERRRIAGRDRDGSLTAGSDLAPQGKGAGGAAPSVAEVLGPTLARPGMRWLNALLTAAVVVFLVWGAVPPEFVFMIAVCVALPLNFPSAKDQMGRIKAHAPAALLMAAILLAAGTFLGILDGTGMLTALATDAVGLMPASVSKYLHVVVGVLGIPLELVLNTDAFFFGLVPVVEKIVTNFGVSPAAAVYPMVIGKVTGTFVCPLAPALWLALGLADLEMGKFLRYAFLWVWGFSLVLLLVGLFFGLFSL